MFFKQTSNKVTAVQKRLASINLEVFYILTRSDGNAIKERGIIIDLIHFVLIVRWLCPCCVLQSSGGGHWQDLSLNFFEKFASAFAKQLRHATQILNILFCVIDDALFDFDLETMSL